MTEDKRITVSKTGFFGQYPIPLTVNIEMDSTKNVRDPKRLRVGEAGGGSVCFLVIKDVTEIDRLMNRLLEIRHEILQNADNQKES